MPRLQSVGDHVVYPWQGKDQVGPLIVLRKLVKELLNKEAIPPVITVQKGHILCIRQSKAGIPRSAQPLVGLVYAADEAGVFFRIALRKQRGRVSGSVIHHYYSVSGDGLIYKTVKAAAQIFLHIVGRNHYRKQSIAY